MNLLTKLGKFTLILTILLCLTPKAWAEAKVYYFYPDGKPMTTEDVTKNHMYYSFDTETGALENAVFIPAQQDAATVWIHELTIPDYIDGSKVKELKKIELIYDLNTINMPKYLERVSKDFMVDGTNVGNPTIKKIVFNQDSNTECVVEDDAFRGCTALLDSEEGSIEYTKNGIKYSICPKTKAMKVVSVDADIEVANIDGSKTFNNLIAGTNCEIDGIAGNTSVKAIIVSEGVTSLKEKVFAGCTALKSLVLPKSFDLQNRFYADNVCGTDVLDGCTSLKNIYVFDGGVPYDIERQADGKYIAKIDNSDLTDGTLEHKPNRMLTQTSGKINIYQALYFFTGYWASFAHNKLPDNAFLGNKNITSVTFSNGNAYDSNIKLTSLGESCFEGCTALDSVISKTVGTISAIGASCFKNCTSLKYLEFNGVIPENSIATDAFSGCDNINTIFYNKYGNNDETLYCIYTKQNSIKLTKGINYLDTNTPANLPEGEKIIISYISDSSTSDAAKTFTPDFGFCKAAGLDAKTYIICDELFKSNTKYTKFDFSGCQSYFGNNCFNADILESLTIDKDDIRIAAQKSADYKTGLLTATMSFKENDATEIDVNTVHQASNVYCIVDNIEENSKISNTDLRILRIRDNYDTYSIDSKYQKTLNIKSNSFSGCTALIMVDFQTKRNYDLWPSVFSGCTSLESVNLTNCTAIDQNCFDNCGKLSKITFGSGLNKIENAFHNCTSLNSVAFPSTHAVIFAGTGNYTFGGCTSLKAIVFDFDFNHDNYTSSRNGAQTCINNIAQSNTNIRAYVPQGMIDITGWSGKAIKFADYRYMAKTQVWEDLVKGYGTVCLPKAIDIANSYNLKNLYDTKLTDDQTAVEITPISQDEVKAGGAYIFARNDRGTENADNENLVVFAINDTQTAATEPINDGILKGTFTKIEAPRDCYIIQSDNQFHVVPSGTGINVGAYRAYLEVPSSAAKFGIIESDNQATAIGNITDGNKAEKKAEIYNLNGQRIATPTKGQIYIIGGKKVVY